MEASGLKRKKQNCLYLVDYLIFYIENTKQLQKISQI